MTEATNEERKGVNVQAGEASWSMQIQIKRADTGKVDSYTLVSSPAPTETEQTEPK